MRGPIALPLMYDLLFGIMCYGIMCYVFFSYFQTLSLLLMEAVLENTLRAGSYPARCMEMVLEDLCREETSDCASVVNHIDSLPQSLLHLAVVKMCKVSNA